MIIQPSDEIIFRLLRDVFSPEVQTIAQGLAFVDRMLNTVKPSDNREFLTSFIDRQLTLEEKSDFKILGQTILEGFMIAELQKEGIGEELGKYVVNYVDQLMLAFSPKLISQNPYIQHINIDDTEIGSYRLINAKYEAFQPIPYGIPAINGPFVIPRFGFFFKDVTFPVIQQNNKAWMSITPIDCLTMMDAIEKARRKVLTLGCGLGYFAFMAAEKPEVESVTIVDISPEVLKVFSDIILPQFPHKEKIHIVCDDAILYLKNLQDGIFDYCFADIWKGNSEIDRQLFFGCKEELRRFKQMTHDCWVEDVFTYDIRATAKTQMVQELNPIMTAFADKYDKAARLNNYTHRLYQKVRINSVKDIEHYTEPKNILHLIEETSIKY